MCNKKNRRLTAEKQQKVYHDWLMQAYPGLFNEQFLPLAVGIFDQLSALLPEHISKTDLRTVLGWYASRIKYLHNIRNLNSRFNLDGTEAGIITEEEKLVAAKKIKEIIQARKTVQKEQQAA
ncbi:MAG: ProQ/FINO family protein [Methylococcales bacterium]|nr:ProQ/FINO family protein [Methylococcales bacterium]